MTCTLEAPKLGRAVLTDETLAQYGELRTAEILEAIEKAEAIRVAWVNDPDDDDDTPPPMELYKAIAEVVYQMGRLPLPASLAPFVAYAEKCAVWLAAAFGHEDLSISMGLRDFDFNLGVPGSAFWEAWSKLASMWSELDRAAELPRLETIAELHEQCVGVPQIAKMHGLSEADVKKEIAEPGSVCGEDYVPPVHRDLLAQAGDVAKTWCAGMVLGQLAVIIRSLAANYRGR